MLKFIPGILFLQLVTIALVLLALPDLENWNWLRLVIPAVIAGILTAFWFGSIAAHQRKDEISRLKESYAQERENMRVSAERVKTEVLKQAQRRTLREVRRSTARANIKIGLAFAGAAGLGGVLILTQFMSLGLLTLTAVGGALGGYLLRMRQEKRRLPLTGRDLPHVIAARPAGKSRVPRDEPP